MKKKFVVPALASLLSVTILATVSATIAWFSHKVSVTTEDNLTGSSDGAYFAYGTGTQTDDPATVIKEGPYGIETARQLYNLAWLQYLGYFNKPESGTIKPVYFELNADIDMSGWILPPIGTTLYPFIGEFNGQGHTITNLTISNDYAEIKATNKMPSKIRRDDSISDVNIVGMFGVIGELDDNITATYDDSVLSVRDFTIAGATIKNSLEDTLMGIAAGYVNGPLENVAITSYTGTSGTVASNLTTSNASCLADEYSQFTNISNYGVVGYCEEEYLGQVKNTVTETYNATAKSVEYIAQDEGDQSGWGGSIDMETTYNGLLEAWSTYNANTAYNASTGTGVYQYARNKTSTEDYSTGEISDSYSNYTNYVPKTNYAYYGYRQLNESNEITSQYTFAHRSDTDRYMYLYGENDVVVENAVSVNSTRFPVQPNCFYITKTVSGTTHYLTRYSATAVTDSTSAANATQWRINDSNQIYTVVDGTTYYYLRNNNGSFQVTNNSGNATAWAITDSYISSVYNNNTYYINYDSGWKFSSVAASATYYTFSVGSNYLSYTSGNNVSNNGTVQRWHEDTNGYYYPEGSTDRKLIYRNSTIQCRTSTDYPYFTWDGEYLKATQSSYYSTTTYYVQYNSGWETTTTAPTRTDRKPVRTFHSDVDITAYATSRVASEGFKERVNDTTGTEDYTIKTQSTYFPLRQKYTETQTSTVEGYKIYYTYSGTRYYLVFDTSASNGLNYTTSEDDATVWNINNNNYIRPASDTSYYLNYANNTIGCTTSTSNRFTYNNNRIQVTVRVNYTNTTYYLYYTGTAWAVNTTQNNFARITIYQKEKHMTGVPEDTNTGYIIGGEAADVVGSIRVSQYYGPGNSSNNNLNGATYSNGKVTLSTVYTIKADNLSSSTITESYSDTYKASKQKLETVLSNNPSEIFGLHFTAADIEYGTGKSAYAQRAVINGDSFSNYELPTNCIDFHLKEKGYINFIAGAYFSGNNTFFTINEVQRDSSQNIVQLRNIAAVYGSSSESNSYIYEYTDYDNNTANKRYSVPFKFQNGQKVTLSGGTYTPYSSSASLPSGYSKLFNCRWIDSKASLQTTSGSYKGYPYYFEIPMNDGEYCMGSPSFSGASGAYLMYLDIGANAKKVYRSEMVEYFKWIDKVYSYPKGVFVMAAGSTNANDQNSYCICLGDEYSGTLTMDRTGTAENDEARYTGTGSSSKESVTYKYPILRLVDTDVGTPVSMDDIQEDSSSTTEIKRLTFYDFNMNTSSLNKVVITDTFVDGVKQGREVERYTNFDVTTQTGTADDTLSIYTISGTTVTKVTNTDTITFATTSNTTKILAYSLSAPNGATITVTFTLNVKATENDGHYDYTPNGYVYTITMTRPDGTTEELTAYVDVTFVLNNDGTYTYTFKINDTNVTGANMDPIVITVPAVTSGD